MSASLDERAFDERLASAREVAESLYRAGARRVWLFGSLKRGRRQDRRSDIDVAVEGLSGSRLATAVAAARRVARGRVDVVPLESAMPSLRAAILRNRVLVPCPGLEGVSLATREPDGRKFGPTLYHRRLQAVSAVLRAAGARRVLDLGCGIGRLTEALARDGCYEAIVGVDYSRDALDAAHRRTARTLRAAERRRITFVEGLLTHRNPAYLGYDAAAAVEVVEHLAEPQLAAFEHVLFAFARPATVVITTPNREYNVVWTISTANGLRKEDHRFEWTRDEFRAWADGVAAQHGYDVEFRPVGTEHPSLGAATHLAVFRH